MQLHDGIDKDSKDKEEANEKVDVDEDGGGGIKSCCGNVYRTAATPTNMSRLREIEKNYSNKKARKKSTILKKERALNIADFRAPNLPHVKDEIYCTV